ncbi:MAG: response regulator [Gammaproteobacteria bacterium]|nr:response regulator [Gammaproteobacteria bacterium]
MNRRSSRWQSPAAEPANTDRGFLALTPERGTTETGTRALRQLRSSYLLGLVALALLTVISHGVLLFTVHQTASDATVINVAGRQRMLSQRVTSLSLQLSEAIAWEDRDRVAELRDRLESAFALWNSSHLALIERDAAAGLSGRNTAAIIGEFAILDSSYRSVQASIEHILTASADMAQAGVLESIRASIGVLTGEVEVYLPRMNAIVGLYERESQRAVFRIELVAWAIGLITLAVLTLEYYFVYEPSFRRMRRQYQVIEDQNTVIERTENAIVLTDAARKIIWVNPGFTRITGYSLQECQGRSPGELLQCDRTDPSVVQQMREKLKAEQYFKGEILNRSKDGTDYWLDLEIYPRHAANGDLIGFVASEVDITAFRDAVQRAEAASRAKSEFLANMSHEIRTPMTAILGFTDLILEKPDAAADTESHARTIQTHAKHLLAIINDILDMSKIEVGQMKTERVKTDPVQIVEEVASLMRPHALKKGLDFAVDYTGDIPALIHSDPTRLRQILLNLVGNAIKFTDSGRIRVEVTCLQEQQQMAFRISDTGIGMTEAQRARVARFEAFVQADSGTTRRFGGTGLGLRISSRLAELLGGSLTLDSAHGAGSEFSVTVATGALEGVAFRELSTADSALLAAQHSHRSATTLLVSDTARSLAGVRVLLAEDGVDNQRLVRFHLTKAGAEVAVAENGQLAVEHVLSAAPDQRPELVLMDMQMPVLDGYAATRRIRADGYTAPIIALTAHAMSGDRDRCLEAGCDDYLTKPIDKQLLVSTCARWLRSHETPGHPDEDGEPVQA